MGLQQVCVCARARACVCILKEKNERKSNQIFN